MANLRFEVVAEAFKKRPVEVEAPKVRASEYFAKYVFNRQKMYKYLPSDVYEKLIDVIDNGSRLDRSIAVPGYADLASGKNLERAGGRTATLPHHKSGKCGDRLCEPTSVPDCLYPAYGDSCLGQKTDDRMHESGLSA